MTTAAAAYQESRGWFWNFIQKVLRSYARNANLAYFQRKYPGLPPEAIATLRIKTAARYAGLIGFISGAIISVAGLVAVSSAIGTVATGLLASPVTVPVLAVSVPVSLITLAGETTFLVRLQLHLAYDLFVLYSLPVDVEDPEQMQEIVAVAFGIKGVEVTGQALQKLIPQLAPQLLRKAMRTGLTRRKIQEWVAKRLTWQFARKYLGEGTLIRVLVPGIAVVTATGWNYYSTKSIGQMLQARIRKRGLAAKEIDKLALEQISQPKLLLQAVLALALTNEDLSAPELMFYSKLVEKLRNLYGEQAVETLKEVSSLDWEVALTELAEIDNKTEQQAIYRTLVAMAIVEGQLQRKKRYRLQKLAELYGFPFDEKQIKARLAPFIEPNPTRTCMTVVLMLLGLTLFACAICGLSLYLPGES